MISIAIPFSILAPVPSLMSICLTFDPRSRFHSQFWFRYCSSFRIPVTLLIRILVPDTISALSLLSISTPLVSPFGSIPRPAYNFDFASREDSDLEESQSKC
ncbi:hypothetical protein EVAR_74906_1 [Eumeta japonica]|uniref:Uncharacterized protein n=1 Tax=Eumeta variegata TaxID=151549 RepID=A0A4C1UJS5_EUMVA|nr:hypothetical protein EVAR_74906_1 [Eumeta japonica]